MRAAEHIHFNKSVLLSNALSAFALNLAVFLLIGKTSALTMNIAGVIKDWCVCVVCVCVCVCVCADDEHRRHHKGLVGLGAGGVVEAWGLASACVCVFVSV